MFRNRIIIILFCLLFLLISCESSDKQLNVLSGNAIGTTYSIRYLGGLDNSFELKIDKLIKEVNKSTSTYIPNSDISRINNGDTTVTIDPIFKEIFYKCERIFNETNGIFDPTVGILVNAWGFGPEGSTNEMDSLRVQELLEFVGFEKVSLINDRIVKTHPEIYFDFNAIGKGYLVDIIGRMFETHGITDYMIEIGGEIRARGVNQNKLPWKIAIENPNFDGSRSFATTVSLSNKSMATSGNYRKFHLRENGEKYVHTINTKTGYAIPSNLLSASVIASSDCADVDAYATAFMAMGLKGSLEFLKNREDLEVFLIYSDDSGTLKTYRSEGLNQ